MTKFGISENSLGNVHVVDKTVFNRYNYTIMNKSTIQVPIDNNLRINAESVASSLGFSSLQEIIRVFITQLANKTISINLVNKTPDEILTEKQESVLIKKLEQLKKGKIFTARSAEEMFNQLGI